MSKIIPWSDVYKDFRSRHPNLKKKAIHYRPYDYLTILIYFDDGQQMIYSFAEHTGYFTKQ